MRSEVDVLVVEDDADITRFILLLLSDMGLSAQTARNGREGYEKATALRPRLVLSDVMMPVMRGDQMVSRLRGNPETARIPCVLMTSAPRAQHDGAALVISKPFDLEQLEAIVRSYVDNQTQERPS